MLDAFVGLFSEAWGARIFSSATGRDARLAAMSRVTGTRTVTATAWGAMRPVRQTAAVALGAAAPVATAMLGRRKRWFDRPAAGMSRGRRRSVRRAVLPGPVPVPVPLSPSLAISGGF
jgi:hypothetical protein